MPVVFLSSLVVTMSMLVLLVMLITSHDLPAWFVPFQEWLGVHVPGVGLEDDNRWGHSDDT